ncbi:MAG: 50S ribosomal protein L30 [Bacillota bacterium]|nr:MAG: 50S ribosomal protein L30 [Bacillota bacterium]
MALMLDIKLVKSTIGYPKRQERTVRALGLRKLGEAVSHRDTPALRGMLRVVNHLVEVRERQETAEEAEARRLRARGSKAPEAVKTGEAKPEKTTAKAAPKDARAGGTAETGKAPAKKAPAEESAAKKPAAQKSAAKKPAGKKTEPVKKEAPAKKAATAKKETAKKAAPARKAAAATKGAPAKKAAAKEGAATKKTAVKEKTAANPKAKV